VLRRTLGALMVVGKGREGDTHKVTLQPQRHRRFRLNDRLARLLHINIRNRLSGQFLGRGFRAQGCDEPISSSAVSSPFFIS
jgi:hypothetical protein